MRCYESEGERNPWTKSREVTKSYTQIHKHASRKTERQSENARGETSGMFNSNTILIGEDTKSKRTKQRKGKLPQKNTKNKIKKREMNKRTKIPHKIYDSEELNSEK